MGKTRVSFKATRKVSKPVTVKFSRSSGEVVKFKAHKVVSKPVKVEFYVKKKKS